MENKIERLLNVSSYLNRIFTKEECDKVFGPFSDRIWSKYWCYVSRYDMLYFNMNFETFNDGAYISCRPQLDEWLTRNLGNAAAPSGFKLVPM